MFQKLLAFNLFNLDLIYWWQDVVTDKTESKQAEKYLGQFFSYPANNSTLTSYSNILNTRSK